MKKIKTSIALLLTLGSMSLAASASSAAKVRKIGDYVQISVPLLALAHTVWHKDVTGAEQLALALYTSQVSVYTLKYMFPVARQHNFENKQSFISGHTMIPMTAAAYLQQRYGWQAAAPAYIMTDFVAYSRVYSGAHRVNEVIGGAVLGQFIGYLVSTSFKDSNVKLLASHDTVGLAFTF